MKSIIIIDDDAAIRDVYELLFREEGYETTCFSNEQPILAGGFKEPDLFLIDKQLHGANGVDLCRYLKSRLQNSGTPVIIFSASGGTAKAAKEAGAIAFLESLSAIEPYLNLRYKS